MNIFVVDDNPSRAAKALCDTHVSKMCLESVQILNTVAHLRGADDVAFYKPTHKNHPCVEWAAESFANFNWLYDHTRALGREFEQRSGKPHKSITKLTESELKPLVMEYFFGPDERRRTPFVCAMPEEYQVGEPIQSYRHYYAYEKAPNDWFGYEKGRPAPDWLQ